MPRDFLHNHAQFADLIRIVADDRGIVPALVEKDYWIMQCLYGLQQLGMVFQLKGGTSLSKGYGLIRRFSEDIDIRIEPPADWKVMAGRNHDKPAHAESRKAFFDRLAATIAVEGVVAVERDVTGRSPDPVLATEGEGGDPAARFNFMGKRSSARLRGHIECQSLYYVADSICCRRHGR